MVLCICGRIIVVKMSWASLNLGHRFHSCPNDVSGLCIWCNWYDSGLKVNLNFLSLKMKHLTCGFTSWVDPPMCERSTIIILGLLRNMNRLQYLNHVLEDLNHKLWGFNQILMTVKRTLKNYLVYSYILSCFFYGLISKHVIRFEIFRCWWMIWFWFLVVGRWYGF